MNPKKNTTEPKFIRILRHFSAAQCRKWQLFIQTPYCAISIETQQFLQRVVLPLFDSDKVVDINLTSDYLLEVAQRSGANKIHLTNAKNIFHQITQSLKKFIAYEGLEQDLIAQNFYFTKFCVENGDSFDYDMNATLHEVDRQLKIRKPHDRRYFFYLLNWQTSKGYLVSKKNIPISDIYKDCIKSIEAFYFYEKLILQGIYLDIGKYIKYNLPDVIESRDLETLRQNNFYNSPVILHHYNLLMLAQNNKPEYYREVKLFFLKEIELLSFSDKKNTLTALQNFCIEQINSGLISYIDEFLSMIEYIPLIEGSYTSQDVKTIILLYVKKYDLKSAHKFLQEITQSPLLLFNDENKVPIIEWANALLHYKNKEYVKAWGSLPAYHSFVFIFHNLSARILAIEILYDVYKYEFIENKTISNVFAHTENLLEKEIAALLAFLQYHKKKIVQQKVTLFVNFANLVLKMYYFLVEPPQNKIYTQKRITKLKSKFYQPMVEQQWILQQFEELVQYKLENVV